MVLNHFNKTALFFGKFQLVTIGTGQIFKLMYKNGLTFVVILPSDNRSSLNFQVRSLKVPYIL